MHNFYINCSKKQINPNFINLLSYAIPMKNTLKYLILICFYLMNNTLSSQTPIPSKPNPIRFVNDYSNLLKAGERARLDQHLRNYYDSTGVELVVVTMPTIGNADPNAFSVSLFNEWGIGNAQDHDGILIFVNTDSTARYARITVGYGLEQTLPDSLCKSILDIHLVPMLKQQKFYYAFLHTAKQLSSFASPDFSISTTTMPKKKVLKPLTWKQKLAVFGFMIFTCIMVFFRIMNPNKFYRRRSRWRSSGGGIGFGGGRSGGGGAGSSW